MSNFSQPKPMRHYYLVPRGASLQTLLGQYSHNVLEPFVNKAKDFCRNRGINKLEYCVDAQRIKATTACFFDLRPQPAVWIKSEDGDSLVPRKKSKLARELARQFNQIEARSLESFLKVHGIESGKTSYRRLEDGSYILACDTPLAEPHKEEGIISVDRSYIWQFHVLVRFQQDGHFAFNELDKSPFTTSDADFGREQDYRRAFTVACRSGEENEFPPRKDFALGEKFYDRAMYHVDRWKRQTARLALSLKQKTLGRDLA